MTDVKKLRKLMDDFIQEVQEQTMYAKTEDDFDEIELVVQDLFCDIPYQIVQKDFYFRSDIKTYLEPGDRGNTALINDVLNKLHNEDIISFEYECVNNSIEETVDEIYAREEKQ